MVQRSIDAKVTQIHNSAELRWLVEKQHVLMGDRNLAQATPCQGGTTVVDSPEQPVRRLRVVPPGPVEARRLLKRGTHIRGGPPASNHGALASRRAR